MTTAARVIKQIERCTALGNHELITPSASLETLQLDSLDRFELILCLEEEFAGLDIEDDMARSWTTVQDIIETVENANVNK